LPLMLVRGGARPVLRAIAAHPWAWLRCAGIGFVLFYVMLSYAAASGPSWLVAGSFQFTVIAGLLCAPLLYRDQRRRIPPAGLGDRKSTRLNSSHVKISYAVFCLKKKKTKTKASASTQRV